LLIEPWPCSNIEKDLGFHLSHRFVPTGRITCANFMPRRRGVPTAGREETGRPTPPWYSVAMTVRRPPLFPSM
jgi:hypothetical protein